jgi:1,4-alpha-glucan branching enzyme
MQSTKVTQPPDGRPRPKRVTLVRCLLLSCMLASAGTGFAASPVALDIAVQSISASQPPLMVNDVLVLSFKPDAPARFVGVRFAHEAWKVLHPYARNEKGVFVLDYPVPEGQREIRYRIVVDGLWMADPSNPQVDTDAVGNEFSVFVLDKEPVRPIINPKQESDGEITFAFSGAPGRRVALVGDFNNWDPFMNPLEESAPGTYTITLRVPSGAHWYYFYCDGQRILDRYNPETGVDPDGKTVSYFPGSS